MEKLRSVGGFLTGEDPAGPGDVTSLVDGLHRATRECIPTWRKEFPESHDRIRNDCRLLLGELLKLGVNKERVAEHLPDLSAAAPVFACRRIGTAVTAYGALRDLPLLFAEALEDGLDGAPRTGVDLDGLATGVGQDARDDVYRALSLAALGRPFGSKTWTADHLKALKAYIAQHWRRDREWYLLITGATDPQTINPAYADIARELTVGLVIRSADGLTDLLDIEEEALIALVCDYLQLLETL